MSQDTEQLQLLAILHYVLAGIMALGAIAPCLYLLVGVFLVSAGPNSHGPSAEGFGWFVIALGGAAFLAVLFVATLVAFSGRSIQRRRNRTYCLVVAAISCLFMPLGTALGVFSLVVLTRESVRELFEASDDGYQQGERWTPS